MSNLEICLLDNVRRDHNLKDSKLANTQLTTNSKSTKRFLDTTMEDLQHWEYIPSLQKFGTCQW